MKPRLVPQCVNEFSSCNDSIRENLQLKLTSSNILCFYIYTTLAAGAKDAKETHHHKNIFLYRLVLNASLFLVTPCTTVLDDFFFIKK